MVECPHVASLSGTPKRSSCHNNCFATFQGKAGVCSVKLILGAIQVLGNAVSLEI